jgi:hypothetical protein
MGSLGLQKWIQGYIISLPPEGSLTTSMLKDGQKMGTGHGWSWSSRAGFARWVAVNVAMPAFLGWVFLEAVIRGNPACLHVIMGFALSGLAVAAIDKLARKGKVAQSEVDEGWDRAERLFSPTGYACKIYKAHRRTFPMPLRQKGTIGTDINRRRKGQGRQGGHKRRGGRNSAKKAASADDGPGEPPEPPLLPQLFLSFLDLALRWSCSSKTLRNQVAIGKLPRPVHLPVGPRFPIAVIQQIESGEWQIGTTDTKSDLTSPTIKKHGRPRIAQSKTLVTAMSGGDQ